ncbi:MAG: DUF4270 family protein [Bacteroidales bacterium]|nr:DUF4270 family protein [Bacteroidales bacterium]
MNNKNTKLRPKNITRLFLGIISIFILIITYSCENETSSLGKELLPQSDKINYNYDTSFTFTGHVFEGEPIYTSDLTNYSLGILNDDYFGNFKGEYVGQFLPFIYDDTIVYYSIDSANLYLDIDSIYGDALNNISFNLFELITEIDDDGEYMSNTDISTYYDPVFKISSNSSFCGDTLVKIPLVYDFINKLTSVDTSVYTDMESFTSVFNGIAIIPEASDPSGGVLFTNMASSDTKIVLYYNDSLMYTYKLPTGADYSKGNGFAKYTYDYSSSIANDYLTNPESENDDLLFLQGINGISTKISLSNINSWLQDDSTYSILNAELIIPVFKDDNFELFYPPKSLFLDYNENDSTLINIQDSEEKIFDGYYNEEKGYYRFFISKHLTKILNGNVEDPSLYLNIFYKSYFPHRVIFQSSENIKLNVTYTKH